MRDTVSHSLTAEEFRRRFRFLILLTWVLPPIVGLSFLLYVQVFTIDQMVKIMMSPLVTPYITLAVVFTVWYFMRQARPISAYLAVEHPTPELIEPYREAIRRFPLQYWSVFVLYLIGASSFVVSSGGLYSDFVADGEAWFRVHLVGLIVSIIVGLPIFFRVLDLFGLTLRGLDPRRPVVTMRVKVLMLGAMMPLLVDSLLVQYYWSRTGYFSTETFVIWIGLEVIAIVGALMFVRSMGQSLAPLTDVLRSGERLGQLDIKQLAPRSVDELGRLASSYQRMVRSIQAHNDLLRIEETLSESDPGAGIGLSIDGLVQAARQSLDGDRSMVFLFEPESRELVAVAATGAPYDKAGYMRLGLDARALPVRCFNEEQTRMVEDAEQAGSDADFCAEHKIRAIIATPLKVGGQVIGVLEVADTGRPRHYDASDVALIEQFANEAAVTISNHWLLEARTQAQRNAVENADRVRLLLDSTVEAIYGTDVNGNCTLVNRACVEMLGYDSPSELLGKSIHDLIHHSYPDGTPYPKKDCRVGIAMRAGESAHSDEEVHWRKDGTAIPVEYWSRPVYEGGELVGSVVAFVDITERRAAEESRRQLQERNELLLESTSDGIIGVDRELCCTFANSAACALLGYRIDDLVGADIHALIHARDDEGNALSRDQLPLQQAIRDESSQRAAGAVLWNSDGDAVPVEYTANPVRDNGQVIGAVMVFRDIAEQQAIARKMDYLASHDPLTGLYNRREFESRLEQALVEARRDDGAHVLCYLDLDQFKVVNDTCGHEAGDELLRQLASLLHGQIRQRDTIARLGGDEFGVLLDGCPVDKALVIADKLRAAVDEYRFAWGDKTFAVGLSIGMVAMDAETENISRVLSAADTACYVAKDSGRNRIHLYEAHDDELNRRRTEMQWVSRINEALDRDMFVLRYQPIVDVDKPSDTGKAMEILLAMRDQDGGEIPPGAFIPAAERYNIMGAVDTWVVKALFAWLRKHADRLDGLERCFINLSGQSIGQEKFLDFLVSELSKGDLPAHKLCFEITETAAVANLSRAIQFIDALKFYGCRFALDDFGSGMSSFAYLKTLPLDYLKIDGNFVRDMASDPIDHAMVKAIHQVGSVMNILTIAEFVEDEAILDSLKDIGVDLAQGYGIARPAPLAGFFSGSPD